MYFQIENLILNKGYFYDNNLKLIIKIGTYQWQIPFGLAFKKVLYVLVVEY